MRLRSVRFYVVGLAFVLMLSAGCSHPSTPQTTVVAVPCPIEGVGSADAPWREVRAAGFTFCVPGNWRSSGRVSDSVDAKRWIGDGGSVSWDLGRPATTGAQGTMTATTQIVGPGSGITPTTTPPPLPAIHTCVPSASTSHTVGELVVVVTQTNCDGTRTTTAWSTSPAFFVQARAYSERVAAIDLAVMRTIQPASPAR
jgi:hypothetical protein